MTKSPATVLARPLGGRKGLIRPHCRANGDDDTIVAEITGETPVVVGIGYLAESEIAGPTVKLDSNRGTTPILITDPRRSKLAGAGGAHRLTDSAAVRGCPALRRDHSSVHNKTGGRGRPLKVTNRRPST